SRSAMADLYDAATASGLAVRRVQSLRRNAWSSLRRSLRYVDHLPTDRLVSGASPRRDRAVDVAEPPGLRPGGLARYRESVILRRFLHHLPQQPAPLGPHRDD